MPRINDSADDSLAVVDAKRCLEEVAALHVGRRDPGWIESDGWGRARLEEGDAAGSPAPGRWLLRARSGQLFFARAPACESDFAPELACAAPISLEALAAKGALSMDAACAYARAGQSDGAFARRSDYFAGLAELRAGRERIESTKIARRIRTRRALAELRAMSTEH